MNKIKFGTDGWRAIIADKFTFENIKVISQALSEYILSLGIEQQGIAISFDTRFMSQKFARAIADVVSSNSIPVFLSKYFTPTPVLSFAVKNRKLAGGIMVTASHNPYYYNGIKFKGNYGGPAIQEITCSIEDFLNRNVPQNDNYLIKKYIHEVDFFPEYQLHVNDFLNFDRISSLGERIIFDPMYGAGKGFLERLLSDSALRVETIHDSINPLFGNLLPEPILSNLSDLKNEILHKKTFLGLATDGDADRFGVLDHLGNFVQLHDLMPLMFSYLLDSRGWSGDVVRTTSMANTIDKLAKKKRRNVIEVPVGFRHVCEKMLTEDVLIGGEESGGFGYKNHIPERDGIFSCLLLLELLASKQKTIPELVREIRNEFGPFSYGRIDEHCSLEVLKKNMIDLRNSPPEKIGEFVVEKVSLIDGIKFYFQDSSWMLMRVSDTEPLGRVYVGSDCDENVNLLLRQGVKLLISEKE